MIHNGLLLCAVHFMTWAVMTLHNFLPFVIRNSVCISPIPPNACFALHFNRLAFYFYPLDFNIFCECLIRQAHFPPYAFQKIKSFLLVHIKTSSLITCLGHNFLSYSVSHSLTSVVIIVRSLNICICLILASPILRPFLYYSSS